MDLIKRFEPFWLLLVVLGGLNYACITLFDTNVIDKVFSGTVLDVVYVVIGFAALTFIPSLMEKLGHMGDYTRAHHA